MHELGVMFKVLDTVEGIAAAQGVDRVSAIVLDIGELSSVIPVFIKDYYPLMIEDRPLFEGCRLEIERTEGIAECVKCGEHYNVVENDGHCPCCNAFEKRVLQGTEFIIKEIQVPADDEIAV